MKRLQICLQLQGNLELKSIKYLELQIFHRINTFVFQFTLESCLD